MPVRFRRFDFTNTTGLMLDVTLEAPRGTFNNRNPAVAPGTTWTINPRVVADSSLTIVDVPAHGRAAHEVRAMGTPVPATIESQTVRFNIGSARIRFTAATHEEEDQPDDDNRYSKKK